MLDATLGTRYYMCDVAAVQFLTILYDEFTFVSFTRSCAFGSIFYHFYVSMLQL